MTGSEIVARTSARSTASAADRVSETQAIGGLNGGLKSTERMPLEISGAGDATAHIPAGIAPKGATNAIPSIAQPVAQAGTVHSSQ